MDVASESREELPLELQGIAQKAGSRDPVKISSARGRSQPTDEADVAFAGGTLFLCGVLRK